MQGAMECLITGVALRDPNISSPEPGLLVEKIHGDCLETGFWEI
jgi:hypothetical protein